MDFGSPLTMTKTGNLDSRIVVDSNKAKVVRVSSKRLLPSSSSSSNSSSAQPVCSHHAQLLLQNYSNFKRSREPERFMYYKGGSWVDFPGEVLEVVKSGFVDGKPVVEAEMPGSKFLFDFHRMLAIDLESGNQRSIAWIDAGGKCYFPKTFVNSSKDDLATSDENLENDATIVEEDLNSQKLKLEIVIRLPENEEEELNNFNSHELNSSKRKRKIAQCDSKKIEKETTEDSESNFRTTKRQYIGSECQSSRWPKARLMGEQDRGYSIVKKLFLSGVEPGDTVTAIHQWIRTSPMDKARSEVFEKQIEMMKKARGEANMVFAWHGTSAKGVESILTHGFGMPDKVPGPKAHGVGIYLSPVRSPQQSAMMSEVDENGEKHVILCRVILGKSEKIDAGSQQLYPSSVNFDSGMDDLRNPKWYVVWCPDMNIHILPECVVSYRPANHMPVRENGISSIKGVSHASDSLLTKLFSKLGSSLPPPKRKELQSLCGSYKDGKLGKDIFMRQLRSVVGDEMLRSTIQEIRG